MKHVLWKYGKTLTHRKPQYTVDSIRGERVLTGYIETDFNGVVRNVRADSGAVVGGIVPADALVVFTDYPLEIGDLVQIDGEDWKVDRIEESKINKVYLKKA